MQPRGSAAHFGPMAVATPVFDLLDGLRNRILDRGSVRRDELRRMMRAAARGAEDLNGSEFLEALSRVSRRVNASITEREMLLLYRHFAGRAGGTHVPVDDVLAALDLPETPPPPDGTHRAFAPGPALFRRHALTRGRRCLRSRRCAVDGASERSLPRAL